MDAPDVDFRLVDAAGDEAQHCLRQYFAEIDRRFDSGFDPELSITGIDELRPPRGVFLVARRGSEPIGCGGLTFAGDAVVIKRMWVAESARGLGLGRRLLAALEEQARSHGAARALLETNRVLAEAIGLYRSAGYHEVEPFNDEPYAHHWFEKRLPEAQRAPNSRSAQAGQ